MKYSQYPQIFRGEIILNFTWTKKIENRPNKGIFNDIEDIT